MTIRIIMHNSLGKETCMKLTEKNKIETFILHTQDNYILIIMLNDQKQYSMQLKINVYIT